MGSENCYIYNKCGLQLLPTFPSCANVSYSIPYIHGQGTALFYKAAIAAKAAYSDRPAIAAVAALVALAALEGMSTVATM